AFVRDPDQVFPLGNMQQRLCEALGSDAVSCVDAARLAEILMGDTITANMLMLGYAWQMGRVPVSAEALLRAIELNGVAVAENRRAFQWGRRAAADPEGVEAVVRAAEPEPETHVRSQDVDECIARRSAFLVAYQGAGRARRYTAMVERVRRVEARI